MARRRAIALILLLIAALYVAATTILFVWQRGFIYPAPKAMLARDAVPAAFERPRLRTSDGFALDALYRPAARDKPTIVFFHGNGDGLAGSLAATRGLAAAGFGILLPEYCGYGGNAGTPDEPGLYRDGEAALSWLVANGVAADRTILIGNSLGSGVATELASRHRVGALVLVSGFSSLPDVAAAHLWMFPARPLLRDRYDSAAKIARVAAPVLLLHGSADKMISPSHTEMLSRAAPSARVAIVPGAGHELAYLLDTQRRIVRWLDEVFPDQR